MTAKFTKGPWKVDGSIRSVKGENGETDEYCAYIHPDYPPYRGTICTIQSCNHIDGITSGEAKANAHLITAAPELYEALDKLARFVYCEDQENELVKNAIKALKKARGE